MIFARSNKDNNIHESLIQYGIPPQYLRILQQHEEEQISDEFYYSRLLKIYKNDIKKIDEIYSKWYNNGIPVQLKANANAYNRGDLFKWEWIQIVLSTN
jgi:hypothetical protein